MSRLNEVLWHRYRELGDLQARVQLLDSYLGLVHHTAHELSRHRPGAPELEDLIGAGTVGLVQALEGFDPLRGLAFSTYAMPRIRGAMRRPVSRRPAQITNITATTPGVRLALPI